MNEQSKDPLLERFSDSVNVGRLLSIFNFSPQTSTFDNLISTGKLALLTNQSLVDSLFVYYNDLNNYTKQVNEGINVYSRNTIAPFLLEFDDIRNPRRKPIDYGNETFIKNVIELKIGLINNLKYRYGNASKRCLNIFEMIDAQLHD